jgi:serine phosphatase RsbU (regulator of sigma subunit)
MSNRLKILIIIISLSLGLSQCKVSAQVLDKRDIATKATYIPKFAREIIWPSSAVPKDFVVGVLGVPEVADIVATTLRGEVAKNKKFEVKHFADYEDIKNCAIVYISTTNILLRGEVFRRLAGKPILIITERPGSLEVGSDINFVTTASGLRFEINTQQIRNKSMLVSSNLEAQAFNIVTAKNDFDKPNTNTNNTPNVNISRPNPLSQQEINEIKRIAKEREDRLIDSLKKIRGISNIQNSILIDSIKKVGNLLEANIIAYNAEKEAAKQRALAQAERLKAQAANNQFRFAILIAVLVLAISLAGVFYYFSQRRKKIIDALQQTRNQLANKVDEVNQKNDLLEKSSKELEDKNREIEDKNERLEFQTGELEEQNRKITDSIRYAMTIQLAMLPTDKILRSTFDDYFIMYNPKDIVSGDFYWLSRQEGKMFVAVVDCTGHGVPGAFMSAIGTDLLNEIVNEKRVFSPGRILELLHLGIYERLRQGDSNNRDGMDVCFCTISPANNGQFLVTFAGAKRPIYYTQDNELKRIGGDSKYIGGILKERQAFTNHEIVLKKGDVLYLTSDGYTDAPNAKRVKFGSQRFFDLLQQNMTKPLDVQKQILLDELHNHQIGTEARDDVTILGVKL